MENGSDANDMSFLISSKIGFSLLSYSSDFGVFQKLFEDNVFVNWEQMHTLVGPCDLSVGLHACFAASSISFKETGA